MYELIIIGAGVAGLTSAIYASRADLNFIVYEQDGFGGGQITSANLVQNYPGLPNIPGIEISQKIKKQALDLGSKIEHKIVEKIIDNGDFKTLVFSDDSQVETKSVIVSTGAIPKKLGISGEKEFLGRGVSYCAVCDGAFFENKPTFVIGGGETAFEEANYLSTICSKVTLINRSNSFRVSNKTLEILKSKPNVNLILNATLELIKGENMVKSVVINQDGELKEYETSSVFVAVGSIPATGLLSNLSLKVDNDFVVADETCSTNIPGVFVAGDIRKKAIRQVVTATADGANAVNSAVQYLKTL